jgi:hypothetical protein
MIAPRLFLCSGAGLTEGDPLCTGRKIVPLDSIGPHANVNIRLENVAKVLTRISHETIEKGCHFMA